MKTYSALIKKNRDGKVENLVLLKEGFSWRAFIFSGLWFLYHKMWKEFLVLILINFAFFFLAKISSDFDKIVLEIFYLFLVALNATYWLEQHLRKKGYELAGVAFGADELSAKFNFLQNTDFDFAPQILDPKAV